MNCQRAVKSFFISVCTLAKPSLFIASTCLFSHWSSTNQALSYQLLHYFLWPNLFKQADEPSKDKQRAKVLNHVSTAKATKCKKQKPQQKGKNPPNLFHKTFLTIIQAEKLYLHQLIRQLSKNTPFHQEGHQGWMRLHLVALYFLALQSSNNSRASFAITIRVDGFAHSFVCRCIIK